MQAEISAIDGMKKKEKKTMLASMSEKIQKIERNRNSK